MMGFSKRTIMIIGIPIAIVLLLTGGVGTWVAIDEDTPKDVTTTYFYDPENEQWIKNEVVVKLPDSPNGTKPKGTNTIIIRVQEDNPVKLIWIAETAIIRKGVATTPLLEINGDEFNTTSSKLNIGQLLFKEVDAQDFRADNNVEVMRFSLSNVVAEDDELKLDLDIVNTVRIMRGAASSLFLGQSRRDADDIGENLIDVERTDGISFLAINARENGLRVDKIRILGPSTGIGFIEDIVVWRTGVDGEIEIKNVEIQDLVLKDVVLDDNTVTP